ncbi:PAS domain S-box protein [Ammoniphilus sp. CFH 90114]|uniref:PAS domain S-box protein n=1 Tax=Ammoniphilus sp. CFH 90114 TaxID=2493665 RepID=UPI00100EEBFC|nr:PAS domain S-box protein [Ammoniphilus sp. CFH 90114]RXT15349.1 PAS domain S-box protein [Ammoniphilus sp. CFH 90114]
MDNQAVNILMVDDRQENLIALEAVLHSPHYNLIRAYSGEEALKWVLRLDFAAILLDVQMPGLDGFETAKLIRARGKSRDIPILFITALSQTHDHVMHGYSVGAIDYIFKPFHPLVLKSKVAEFVKIYQNQQQIQMQKELLKKRAEELEVAYSQLRRSEALARAIGESSIDTLITMDASGEIYTVNPGVRNMFGYVEEEISNQNIAKLLPIFQTDEISNFPKSMIIEVEARRKDGSLFPAEVQVSQVTVEEEVIFVCSIRDITERKIQYHLLECLVEERTQELKQSEDKYRQLVEESPEIIIVRKLHSDICSFINKTGLNLLGAERMDQIIGKSVFDWIHPEDHTYASTMMEDLRLGKEIDVVEERWVRLDGTVIDVELKTIPTEYQGEPAIYVFARDITEWKKSQEILQQSEKLSVVGELAAGIAHEIRNPLTSLRGFVQLLDLEGGFGKEYGHIMLSEIDRINMIVSELLLLAKPKKMDFQEHELKLMLDSIITLLNAQANLHGVEIVAYYSDTTTHYPVVCEENKLKQVFINILKNAIEAMPDGGQVRVEVDRLENDVSIAFIDQGNGIPSEQLSLIGQPFYTTKDKGTGLGLMVSHSIIQNHQGKLKISSEVGKGTLVEVVLPTTKVEKVGK